MRIKYGNILESPELAIAHQVNCMNSMGSGVAKALYTKWPEVKSQYHKFCNSYDRSELLGKVQTVTLPDGKIIFNAFSQYECGHGKCYTNYDAVRCCFHYIKMQMTLLGIEQIALPYLYGCGLAGGDWSIVSNIIDDIFGDGVICYRIE